jgi:hypothetical protein
MANKNPINKLVKDRSYLAIYWIMIIVAAILIMLNLGHVIIAMIGVLVLWVEIRRIYQGMDLMNSYRVVNA